MAPKRPFGHANRGGSPEKAADRGLAPASVESLSEEEYARLVAPLRQGAVADEDATEAGGLLALFTTSRYRYWLWLGVGAVLLLMVQIVGFGDSIVPDDVGSRSDDAATVQSPDGSVEVTSVAIDADAAEDGTVGLGGDLVNRSEGTVVAMTLALTLYDCLDGSTGDLDACTRHDEILVDVGAEVPAGETGPFRGSVSLADFPPIEGELEITYRIDSVEVN